MVELYNEEKEDIPLPGQEPIESGESNLPLGISETENPTFFGNSIFTGGYLRSKNFITNVSGWELTSIGGEFNFAVSIDSLDIPDTITANSFHVDLDGNAWWGATTLGASVASVTKAGLGTFSNIVITGANSTFNGSLVTDVQSRAESLWKRDFVFLGFYIDGLTATVDAGCTITRQLLSTSFVNNGAANTASRLSSPDMGQTIDGGVINWADGDFEFSCHCEYSDTTDQDSFLGLFDGVPVQNATDITRHIGFYLQDGTMYASNADGTTQTKTSIAASVTLTNMTNYRFVFDTGVNVKFYANDVLVATHTTNLPAATSGNEPNLVFWLNGATDGVANMTIKNNYLVTLEI